MSSRTAAGLRWLAAVVVALTGGLWLPGAGIRPAQALVIDASYAGAGWTTSAQTDVTNVINALTADFTSNATVNIQFDWGSVDGQTMPSNALGATVATLQSANPGAGQTALSVTESLLTQAAANQPTNAVLNTAVAHLPALTSAYSTYAFDIPTAEYLALGGVQTAGTIDAYVGLGTSPGSGWSYSGGTPASGQYDLTSVLEHEITHALGRVDYAFSGTPFLTPLDFYKYDCGTTTLDPNFNNTCFSINGGATDLLSGTAGVFNNTSDSADWQNLSTPSNCGGSDSFDSCLMPGVQATVSALDLTTMCALGWNGAACATGASTPVPEPASAALIGSALLSLAGLRRRRPARSR